MDSRREGRGARRRGRPTLRIDLDEVLRLRAAGVSFRRISRTVWAWSGERRVRPSPAALHKLVTEATAGQ